LQRCLVHDHPASGGRPGILEPVDAVVHARDLAVRGAHFLQEPGHRAVESDYDGGQHGHVIAQAGEVRHDPFVLAGDEIEIGVGRRGLLGLVWIVSTFDPDNAWSGAG
jgi:hypothetical protein